MQALTQQSLRTLAGFRSEGALVTSCYLDIDGRLYPRFQDVQQRLDALLRKAHGTEPPPSSVAADLKRIREHVRGGVDRSRARGLAMFACSPRDLWEVVELPVRVTDQVVIDTAPALVQLERVVEDHEPIALLLADRHRARILVYSLGELVERTDELVAAMNLNEDRRDVLVKTRLESSLDEAVHQHLRHAAHAAMEIHRQHPFHRLVLAAPSDLTKALEAALHPYLRERIVARINASLTASDAEIRTIVDQVEQQVERATEAELVGRLRDAAGSGRRGAAGLRATLAALVERRVETLLVSRDYAAPGWHCESCRFLGLLGRSCPVCGQEMRYVDDIVQVAVDEALTQSCRVEVVTANADLDVLGGIGALLRY